MQTENLTIDFSQDGISRIAEIAWQVNESTENIGARRLHTVMEKLLEPLSYDASTLSNDTVVIDAKYVDKQLNVLIQNEDLTRYIL